MFEVEKGDSTLLVVVWACGDGSRGGNPEPGTWASRVVATTVRHQRERSLGRSHWRGDDGRSYSGRSSAMAGRLGGAARTRRGGFALYGCSYLLLVALVQFIQCEPFTIPIYYYRYC